MKQLLVFTDGGARGNPGPAAIAAVIGSKKYAEYIGKATNNEAEYKAIIFALKKVRQLLGKKKLKETEVIINSDSELVINQLNGRYKILESELGPLFLQIWNLKFDFPHLTFHHIPREKNKTADQLVNEVLDKEARSQSLKFS